jgi:hypothetical protein
LIGGRVDAADRKIGLSRKKPGDEDTPIEGATETPSSESKPEERKLRGGMGSGGNLINLPEGNG